MKINKFVKIMNKLGVVPGRYTHVDILEGRYTITFNPRTTELPADDNDNLGDLVKTVSTADLYNTFESGVMKAYFEFNHVVDTGTLVCKEYAEKLRGVDEQLCIGSASHSFLEELVCSEMLREHILLDNVLDYFESLDISYTIQKYMSGGWLSRSTPLTISEYVHNKDMVKELTSFETDTITAINSIGDLALLSTTIESLAVDSDLMSKVATVIEHEGYSGICKQLELHVKNMDNLPTVGVLRNIISCRLSDIVREIDKTTSELSQVLKSVSDDSRLRKPLTQALDELNIVKQQLDDVFV